MKKITLLVSAFAVSLAVNAQDFSAQSAQQTTVGGPSTEAILADQPVGGTDGIVSCYSNADALGVYSSDDFNLSDSNQITVITAYGFNNNQNFEDDITGMDIYVYNNLSGFDVPESDPTQPGTGVIELVDVDPLGGAVTITADGSGGFTVAVDVTAANGGTPIVLPAGDYWVVAAPRMNNIDGFDGANRWNWYNAGVPDAGVNEAHLIDPGDVFGAGATTWTSFTDLGLTFGSTAFTIEGEPALGVNDNLISQVSIFPNPASSKLNVSLPANLEINSAVLFDVLGKNTGIELSNNTMNIGSLARGVYILTLETSAGSISQKIVKQ